MGVFNIQTESQPFSFQPLLLNFCSQRFNCGGIDFVRNSLRTDAQTLMFVFGFVPTVYDYFVNRFADSVIDYLLKPQSKCKL